MLAKVFFGLGWDNNHGLPLGTHRWDIRVLWSQPIKLVLQLTLLISRLGQKTNGTNQKLYAALALAPSDFNAALNVVAGVY